MIENTANEEQHDISRIEKFMRSRQRVAFLSAVWRPMLAGAVGAGLVIAAVAIAQPKFTTREVIVDHVTQRDVPFDSYVPQSKTFDNHVPQDKLFDNHIPHDKPFDNAVPVSRQVEVDIPRVVVTPPPAPAPLVSAPQASAAPAPPARAPTSPARALAPRSPKERAFERSWGDAVVRGRILGPAHNGFALMTENGATNFLPARIGADGYEVNTSVRDNVDGLVGSLAYCRLMPNKTYECRALTARGDEIIIPEIPLFSLSGQPM